MANPTVQRLQGAQLIAALKASSIEFIAALPDITTVEGVLKPISRDAHFRFVRVCKEDEGVGILAGLSFADKRGVLLMQSTGLLDSINALRNNAVEYSLPICMMVGLIGKEPGVLPKESKDYGVRIVEPILDAMGITRLLIETDEDVPGIEPAIARAYRDSKPLAILIGRRPEAAP
ncbi:MAG: decarboxylase [Betaproteobacteria bacterium]|nr:decarboxylase [Betaproteobacteria bacterium]